MTTANFLRRMLEPDPATPAQTSEPDEIAARILQAALEQFELVGVRRTTLQDVARRCGVGRATLYRRFATKEALVDAVVIAEVRRFLIGSARARAQGKTFEESGINSTIFTVKFLRDHALLNKLVQTEPENIMPRFAGDAAALLEFIVDYSTAQWRNELFGDATPRPDQEQHLRTASELTTRLAISFILTPQTRIPLDSDDEICEYARNYIMPILTSAKAYPR